MTKSQLSSSSDTLTRLTQWGGGLPGQEYASIDYMKRYRFPIITMYYRTWLSEVLSIGRVISNMPFSQQSRRSTLQYQNPRIEQGSQGAGGCLSYQSTILSRHGF